MTEPELIDAARQGNRAAFGQLVERYQRMVEAAAFGATGRHDLVDDVVQDTFIAAWRTLDRLRDAESLRPWLYGIARNLARKAHRRQVRTPVASTSETDLASPLDTLVERERDAEIATAVRNLPTRYREPLVLFYYEHCSVKEVAAALAMHEDAAMQRLSRGRRKLGEALAARVETALESKTSRAALVVGLLLLLPTRTSVAAPVVASGTSSLKALLLPRWRVIGMMLGTVVVALILAFAIERSNAVAAHAAARAADPTPTTTQARTLPTLPTPWTTLTPRFADPDHIYRSMGIALLSPAETCAAGARQLVMSSLGAAALVERDGTTYFEPPDELLRISDEASARAAANCGGDRWPELYMICEGTLADIRDGTINCYPHDAFAFSDTPLSAAPPRREDDIVIITR